MSRDELSRLMGDALADPDLIREAMTLKDRPALESFVRGRGYALTPDEMDEIWELASKVLGGGSEDAARWRSVHRGQRPPRPAGLASPLIRTARESGRIRPGRCPGRGTTGTIPSCCTACISDYSGIPARR